PRTVQLLARQVVAAVDPLVGALAAVDGPINLVPAFQRLALEIIGGAIFSLDPPSASPFLAGSRAIRSVALSAERGAASAFCLHAVRRRPAHLCRLALCTDRIGAGG